MSRHKRRSMIYQGNPLRKILYMAEAWREYQHPSGKTEEDKTVNSDNAFEKLTKHAKDEKR